MYLSLTVTTILTLAAAAAVAACFFRYASSLRKAYLQTLSEFDTETEGSVLKQWKTETAMDNGETATTWYVSYRYTVNGQEYETESGIGHYKKMFRDGQAVTLLYRSDDPKHIYVPEENAQDRTVYKTIYVLGGLAVFAGVLIMILAGRLA